MKLYSESTKAFYAIEFLDDYKAAGTLPDDVKEVTDKQESALRFKLLPNPDQRPPIPKIVSMKQARLALLQFGLLANVNNAIAAGSEAEKIIWEFASDVNRSDPLVAMLAGGLNLKEVDLDALFTLAATL